MLLHCVDEVVLSGGHSDDLFVVVEVTAVGGSGRLPVASAASASATVLASTAELTVGTGSLVVEVVAILDVAILVVVLVAEAAPAATPEGSLGAVFIEAGRVLLAGRSVSLVVVVGGGGGVSCCSCFHLSRSVQTSELLINYKRTARTSISIISQI
jgi:hypothetical protein